MIKGVFVNSHVKVLEKIKGKESIKALEKKLGRKANFKYLDDVPVSQEVKIIDFTLKELQKPSEGKKDMDFESGRLHFKNFVSTPYGRMLMSVLEKDIKKMLLSAPKFIKHIFKNVSVKSKEIDQKRVKIWFENSGYPLNHMRGVLYEWLVQWGYNGEVKARKISPNILEYIVKWELKKTKKKS